MDARLTFAPEVLEQEFVSPGGMNKYEDASKVLGSLRGEQITGTLMIEWVGDWK